jgi:hypothetical protein
MGDRAEEAMARTAGPSACCLTNVAADKHFSDAASPQRLYCACS